LMTTKRVTFDKLSDLESNVHHLGSLCFDKRDELGPQAYIDLRNSASYPHLARDFIAALYEHTSPSTMTSDLSLGAYRTLIGCFQKYCVTANIPFNFRMKDIDSAVLEAYKAYLAEALSSHKAQRRRRRYGDLLRLIAAGQALG